MSGAQRWSGTGFDRPAVLRAGCVVAWAGFFLWLWIGDGMTRYLGPRTYWVVPFGAITLTLVALGQLRGMRSRGDARRLRGVDVVGAGLLLLPLVAVATVPSADLGSLAASRKATGGISAPRPDTGSARVEDPSFIDIRYAEQSDRYARVTGVDDGRQVELVGFVTKEPEATGDTFELTRFYISCCAADAIPHSVTVDPGSYSGDLPENA